MSLLPNVKSHDGELHLALRSQPYLSADRRNARKGSSARMTMEWSNVLFLILAIILGPILLAVLITHGIGVDIYRRSKRRLNQWRNLPSYGRKTAVADPAAVPVAPRERQIQKG